MAKDKTIEKDQKDDADKNAEVAEVKVRAIATGFYDKLRVVEEGKKGEEFLISGERYTDGPKKGQLKAFSSKWMELV